MARDRRPSRAPWLLALFLGLGIQTGGPPIEAQQPASRAATPAEAGAPRLIGVVIAQEGRGRAYLQDVRTGGVRAYEVGEAVGDARVVAIEPDRVVLDRGGTRTEIRFGGAPTGGGTPAESAAPPPVPPAGAGLSPGPAAGVMPPVCPPDCPPAPAPGQPGMPPAPSSGCPPSCPPALPADPQACPPNCPAPGVPPGPAIRPSP